MSHKQEAKKPVNPYIKWRAENIEEIKRNNPKANSKQLQAIVSEAWKNYSEADKQALKDSYSKEIQKYAADADTKEEEETKVSEKKAKLNSIIEKDEGGSLKGRKKMKVVTPDSSAEPPVKIEKKEENKPMNNVPKKGRQAKPV